MATGGEITLFIFEFLVMLACIYLGSRMGGLGIGFYGGVGVIIYGFGFQLEPGSIPFDVISIIMAVVSAIGSMQVAGGMDYLVYLCSKALKKYPKMITYVGGVVVYVLTTLAGTGHVSYSCLPVIAEVAKESGIRPSRALAAAVVGSMIGIVSSPISAAIAWLSTQNESTIGYTHAGYAQILAVMIPSTFIGLLVGAFVSSLLGKSLYEDKDFLERVADGRCVLKKPLPNHVQIKVDAIKDGNLSLLEALETPTRTEEEAETAASQEKHLLRESATDMVLAQDQNQEENKNNNNNAAAIEELMPHTADIEKGIELVEPQKEAENNESDEKHTFHAKLSVYMFLTGIILVVIYSLLLSETILPSWNPEKKKVGRNDAIVSVMIGTAALIAQFCKVNILNVSTSSTFRAGMNGSLCMLGVAWMGNTFVSNQLDFIKEIAGDLFGSQAWLFPLVLFIASALLYSQASTANALYPLAYDLNLSPLTVVASYPAVCGLFILPTYPTLVAACQMDDTGTTRAGKFIVDHPFIIPGTCCVAVSVALSFALGAAII